MSLTEREQKVVKALTDRCGGIYSKEIAQYAGLKKEEIAGVVGSLVKKNVVKVATFGPDEEYLELVEA